MDHARDELCSFAEQILRVCHALDGRVSHFRDSPITRLARQEVLTLQVEGKALACMITTLRFPQTDAEDRLLQQPNDITERMRSTRLQLFRALSISDFALRNTIGGDDEELDAIFASIFLLGKLPLGADDGYPLHMQIKDSQMLTGLCNFVALLDGMWPEAQRYADKASSQLAPRYGHMYTSENDPPYRIDRAVDPRSGSFGTVHKTMDNMDGDAYAVKVFHKVSWNNNRQKILREIGVLELCMHRNIVKLVEAYEVATVPNVLYVVMSPWVPVTLDDLIRNPDQLRRKTFPWFAAGIESTLDCSYRLMHELADGLAYLHRMSLKHKDLKPENILLQHATDAHRITPLITDFGVSKVFRVDGATRFTNSTYEFLSLEQLNHEESSLKSDIWQLGCCYSYMLCVASGGSRAANIVCDSYMCQPRACNIAREAEHFKKALHQMVVYRGQNRPREKRMFHIVADGMLDLDPSTRLTIDMVRDQMASLQEA